MKNPSAVISALRLIFWGGLLCIIDLHFSQTTSRNGVESGFRFDLLNDVFGMILIGLGIRTLSRLDVNRSYAKEMGFIFMACIVGGIVAIDSHFLYEDPALIALLRIGAGMVTLAATLIFCVAMGRVAEKFGLPRSLKSWKTTKVLVIVLWVAPLGLSYTSSIINIIGGGDFSIDLGPMVIPILLLFLWPLVHTFISTSRMKNEIEGAGKMLSASSVLFKDG